MSRKKRGNLRISLALTRLGTILGDMITRQRNQDMDNITTAGKPKAFVDVSAVANDVYEQV